MESQHFVLEVLATLAVHECVVPAGRRAVTALRQLSGPVSEARRHRAALERQLREGFESECHPGGAADRVALVASTRRLGRNHLRVLRRMAACHFAVLPDDAQALLARRLPDRVRVSGTALHPAVAATLLSLQARMRECGVELVVDLDESNGQAQIRRVARDPSYDFVIAADTSFVFGGKLPYSLAHPVTSVPQTVFERLGRRTTRTRCVSVYAESSNELHCGLRRGFDGSVVKIDRYEDTVDLPERLSRVEPGDRVVAWGPMIRALQADASFTRVPASTLHYPVSIISHDALPDPAVDAFRRLFGDRWRRLRSDPKAASELVLRSPRLLERFVRGAALRRVPA